MKRTIGIAGTILVIVLVIAMFAIMGQPSLAPTVNTVIAAQLFGADYVGSDTCGVCHEETYDVFIQSGHPWKLNKVVDGQPPE